MRDLSASGSDFCLGSSIFRCLLNWWNADQVRVPNAAGRLLSLRAGTQIQLLQQIWNVTLRETKCHDDAADLKYSLTSIEDGHLATLHVHVLQSDRNQITAPAVLCDADDVIPVWDTDVVCLATPGLPGCRKSQEGLKSEYDDHSFA